MGATSSEVTSPMPPVECLSSTGPGQGVVVPAHDRAGIAHGRGQQRTFVVPHALEINRHGEGAELLIANRAVGNTADQFRDGRSVERFAVALASKDVGDGHQ